MAFQELALFFRLNSLHNDLFFGCTDKFSHLGYKFPLVVHHHFVSKTFIYLDNIRRYFIKDSRDHPYKGWLEMWAISPCYQTASQGASDFLFVQVTIALDALHLPLEGASSSRYALNGSSYSFTLNLSCIMSYFS